MIQYFNRKDVRNATDEEKKKEKGNKMKQKRISSFFVGGGREKYSHIIKNWRSWCSNILI